MTNSRKLKTVTSSLWAAYGDALGFPTELASKSMVLLRIGSKVSSRSVAWRRLIGGRFGAQVDLCKGAYSDDTQLRLATARAIGSDGFFDVESFAKVELPVWLSYCLGAGRGSKTAANAMCDRSVNWFSNFFATEGVEYVKGGGNGAAMRIQPHVWSAVDLTDERSILIAVVRNSVCTHGHVRGIAGAMIHAVSLARILRHEEIADPSEWIDLAEVIKTLPELIETDGELATFWLPTWEKLSETSLNDAVAMVVNEWKTSINSILPFLNSEPSIAYLNILQFLGGLTQEQRGSGLKSALFSLVAAWLFRKLGAKSCIETIVNVLESDTDTIASMAGALIGALPGQALPDDVIQDKDFLEKDAIRLYQISQKISNVERFIYPDLLYWQAPKSALDTVGVFGSEIVLSGLGRLEALGDEFLSTQKGTVWQWFRLEFGQTVLCKRRTVLKQLLKSAINESILQDSKSDRPSKSKIEDISRQPQWHSKDLFSEKSIEKQNLTEPKRLEPFSIESMTDSAIRSNFDPTIIGEALLRICKEENAIELALGYAAIVVKARTARLRKNL